MQHQPEPSPVAPGTGDLVSAAADLGRRDAERHLQPYDLDVTSALVVTRLRDDEKVVVTDLESRLAAPFWPRGAATLHDWRHFADYVSRLAVADHTTVWAQPDRGLVTAVFDDHADADTAGWRSHTAVLALQPDPDWGAWLARDNYLGGQAEFAEQVEGLAHTVIEPDAATMLEIARTFDAKRSVAFKAGVRLDSGDVQLTYEETTRAKVGENGRLEVPAAFSILVAPYVGMDAVPLTARLRWRITEGELKIGYALLRPDRALRDAMTDLVEQITARIASVPVYLGDPPASLRQ